MVKLEAIIKELSDKYTHSAAIAAHDGTNTGVPTAATPIGKKKIIPNSLRCSGKKLISSTVHDRKTAIGSGENSYLPEYVENFKHKVRSSLAEGWEEDKNPEHRYMVNSERLLLIRTDKYYNNYFRWVEDFSLPTTNNLSERGLRCI